MPPDQIMARLDEHLADVRSGDKQRLDNVRAALSEYFLTASPEVMVFVFSGMRQLAVELEWRKRRKVNEDIREPKRT